MDEEEIEYFEEDVIKVNKIENRKLEFSILNVYIRCHGNRWCPYSCL